jgi:hypothetical protein
MESTDIDGGSRVYFKLLSDAISILGIGWVPPIP